MVLKFCMWFYSKKNKIWSVNQIWGPPHPWDDFLVLKQENPQKIPSVPPDTCAEKVLLMLMEAEQRVKRESNRTLDFCSFFICLSFNNIIFNINIFNFEIQYLGFLKSLRKVFVCKNLPMNMHFNKK